MKAAPTPFEPRPMPTCPPIRVLALIPPIERHVGHWACSSPSISLTRVIMEGGDTGASVLQTARQRRPQAIAIVGKHSAEYLDLIDELAKEERGLRHLPRIYRCQNTVLAHRAPSPKERTRDRLAALDPWFARGSDPRFSLILVQTLDDVDLIQGALPHARVVACPYGYDTAVFDPSLPELERTVDVGCYFNLKDDPRRIRLVDTARGICERRGWTFCFRAGRYWQEYAEQIRATKVCLHYSLRQEVPYRMYEATSLGALFLTDSLRYGVDSLFTLGREYLTFQPDFGDLETVLDSILADPARWNSIRRNGRRRAEQYTWPRIAEQYVVPPLRGIILARGLA